MIFLKSLEGLPKLNKLSFDMNGLKLRIDENLSTQFAPHLTIKNLSSIEAKFE